MTHPAWAATARSFLHAAALCLGLASTAQAAGWQSAGFVNGARSQHTATELPDGRVLIAGGFDGSAAMNTTRLYDPLTRSPSAGPDLPGSDRMGHTATLLRNGQVLIAGGSNGGSGSDSLYSTVTFDAETGQFAAAGNLASARSQHTATLLQDGRVFVMGGDQNGSAVSTSEIYNPATRSWTQNTHTLGSSAARLDHTATLLPDGRVLVAGGRAATGALSSVYIWNPIDSQWTAGPSMPGGPRWGHTATLLPGGKVLFAGGRGAANSYKPLADVYDSNTGAWEISVVHTPRYQHTATLLPDGRVLIAGGMGASGYVAGSEVYSLASGFAAYPALITPRRQHTALLLHTGTVLVAGGMGGFNGMDYVETNHPATFTQRPTADLPQDRIGHTATLTPSGHVYIAGGSASGQPTASVLRYRPENGVASAAWLGAAPMTQARIRHTQTLLGNGRILLAGGTSAGSATASADLYHATADTLTSASAMLQARDNHTATLLPSGGVLVTGGNGSNPTPLGTAEIYHPASNQWQAAANMSVGRSGHTATRLPDGRVMVTGGISERAEELASVEFYLPATGQWNPGPAMDRPRSGHHAVLLQTGDVLVLHGDLSSAQIFNPATNAWSAAALPQTRRSRYTATLLPDGRVFVAGGSVVVGASTVDSARTELYDPVHDTWDDGESLSQACSGHTATLLNTGRVLVAGCGASLFDEAVPQGRRPAIVTAGPATLTAGSTLILHGQGFTGDSEGSGGGTGQSSTHAPLVALHHVDGGPVLWLASQQSSATEFTSRPVQAGTPFQPGLYRATLYVNGIPSNAVLLHGDPPAAAAPGMPRNVAAIPGSGQVTITWQAPAGGTPPERYTVTAQPGGRSCTVQAPATSCTVTGLTNGVAYTFTVTASNAGGITSAPPTGEVIPVQGNGNPGSGGVQAVPTLGEWGVLLLAALMLIAGVHRVKGFRPKFHAL